MLRKSALVLLGLIFPFFLILVLFPAHSVRADDPNCGNNLPIIVSPHDPTPNDSVNVTFTAKNTTESSYHRYFLFMQDPKQSSQHRTIYEKDDIEVVAGQEYNFNIYLGGNDKIKVGNTYNIEVREFTDILCGYSAITVRDASTPSSNIKFTDPSAKPWGDNPSDPTLPLIKVVGVTPGTEYKFTLGGNWRKTELKDASTGSNVFKSGSDVLEVKDICSNGEANRNEANHDACGDPFGNGSYTITLVDVEMGTQLSSTTFQVGNVKPPIPIDQSTGGNKNPVTTPLGNFEVTPEKFASQIARLAIGIAGGIAFLLMVFGAYRLIFSGGNPDSVQQGKEVLTAAVIGLVVIIFAVFLLRLIGISILGLPI